MSLKKTIEDELKQYILSKYKSIRAFTQTACIPYSTIDTMLKRGIGGTGVSTMIKICKTLSIDTESLINGKIVEINSLNKNKDFSVSNHEKKIIVAYRQQPTLQEAVDKLLGVEKEYIEVTQKEKHA